MQLAAIHSINLHVPINVAAYFPFVVIIHYVSTILTRDP